jgi:hypothetical protein
MMNEISSSFALVSKLRFEDSFKKLTTDFSQVNLLEAELAKFSPAIESALFEFARLGTLSISQGLTSQLANLAATTPNLSDILRAQVSSLPPALEAMNQLALRSHLLEVSQTSLLAQRLSWELI